MISAGLLSRQFKSEFLHLSLQNMKLCLLFCASAGDLKLCDIDDDGSPATTTHSGGKESKESTYSRRPQR